LIVSKTTTVLKAQSRQKSVHLERLLKMTRNLAHLAQMECTAGLVLKDNFA
jgi:Zn-dependent oligopeptidase